MYKVAGRVRGGVSIIAGEEYLMDTQSFAGQCADDAVEEGGELGAAQLACGRCRLRRRVVGSS